MIAVDLFEAIELNDIETLEKNLSENNVNQINEAGQNLLVMAILKSNPKAVKIILKLKPNLNFAYGMYNWNALHLASNYGLDSIVKLLVVEDIDINQTDSIGNTAFILACKKNYLNVAQTLMCSGCSMYIKNKAGFQAQFYIASIELFALFQKFEADFTYLDELSPQKGNLAEKLINRDSRF